MRVPETAVLLASLPPTALDLRFSWFGVPVRAHPLFWLSTLLLGPLDLNRPYALEQIAIWMFAVTVSILMHELGHVLAYKYYRCGDTHIELQMCCGLAFANREPRGHWRRIAVSFAGPGIQFVIVFLLWLSIQIDSDYINVWKPYSVFLFKDLFFINLVWAIFNLLPIFPLDGGNICREICFLLKVNKPLERSLKISIGTAVGVIVMATIAYVQPSLLSGLPWWVPRPYGLFTFVFMASLAYSNYMALKQVQHDPWGHNEDDREPWES